MNYEGRNRRLQGLTAAILKLWEKSLIAKIAIKFGVPNTDNESMANELKAETSTSESLAEFEEIQTKLEDVKNGNADLNIQLEADFNIFDGVLEGLHQHWKHREVVKVITKQRLISRVIYTAKMLESWFQLTNSKRGMQIMF
ncbi:hypothetical protein HN51_067538 [Arachis hypogaea]